MAHRWSGSHAGGYGDNDWVPKKRNKNLTRAKNKTMYIYDHHDEGLARQERELKKQDKNFWLKIYLLPILFALLFVVFLQLFVVQPFSIPSASMAPSLNEGERILIYKPDKNYEIGDIVVFQDPNNWLSSGVDPVSGQALQPDTNDTLNESEKNGEGFLVKRIVGLPGDTVECCTADGKILINGTPYEEPFMLPTTQNEVPFSVIVPNGSYFVLGDNRSESADSRFHLDKNSGAVPKENIQGKVFLKIWPLSSLEKLNNPNRN